MNAPTVTENTLTEWIKPSGVRVMLNDEEGAIEYAKGDGWKRYDETKEGLAEAEEILVARELRAENAVAAAKEQEPGKEKSPAKSKQTP